MINNDDLLPSGLLGIMKSDIALQTMKISKNTKYNEKILMKLDSCISKSKKEKTEILTRVLESHKSKKEDVEDNDNKTYIIG